MIRNSAVFYCFWRILHKKSKLFWGFSEAEGIGRGKKIDKRKLRNNLKLQICSLNIPKSILIMIGGISPGRY